MTDPLKIEPALTAEQWGNRDRFGFLTLGDVSDRLSPRLGAGSDPNGHEFSVQDDWGEASDCPLVVAIAVANDALPSDDLRKITWEWIRTLRSEARSVGSGGLRAEYEDEPYRTQAEREARLRKIADALASYLPPREAMNATR